MTPEPRSPLLPAAAEAVAQRHRQRWALAVGAAAAVGLGAMLGHGLGQSLAALLPASWVSASPALLGAAVALMLVPLSGWAVLRRAVSRYSISIVSAGQGEFCVVASLDPIGNGGRSKDDVAIDEIGST